MRVNYLGNVWCLRAFLPALEAGAPSDVVNVVSVAGTVVMPPSGPYGASKHAQLAFSRATAAQLRSRGVRVHSVLPGFAETEGFPQKGVIPKKLEWTIIGPERIARSILGAVRHDRRESFVPWWYRPVAILQAVLPSVVGRVLGRGTYGGPGAV
jgi:3-oxoacyl-[acyl-carrier protein] reductase